MHRELRLLPSVYVDHFKMAGPTEHMESANNIDAPFSNISTSSHLKC